MTTIAFRARGGKCGVGEIAADTQMTASDIADGRVTKVMMIRGIFVAAGGTTVWCRSFADWVQNGMRGEHPTSGNKKGNGGGCGAIFPGGTRVIHMFASGLMSESHFELWTDGSGGRYAMGALHAGLSPREAVRVACFNDIYSSEPIRSFERTSVDDERLVGAGVGKWVNDLPVFHAKELIGFQEGVGPRMDMNIGKTAPQDYASWLKEVTDFGTSPVVFTPEERRKKLEELLRDEELAKRVREYVEAQREASRVSAIERISET